MMVNPFNPTGYDTMALSAAIRNAPFPPGRIGALGLFVEAGVASLSIAVEEETGVLGLVPVTARGAPGVQVARPTRAVRDFRLLRLAPTRTIMADEVQGVRAFGADAATEVLATVVAARQASLAQQIEVTREHLRIGAIKGQLLDADGATVLYNLYSEFGVTQTTLGMALTTATTKVRQKCSAIIGAIEDALGAVPLTGVHALCGQNFWNELIEHDAVVKTYLNSQYVTDLRGDPREVLPFGGIVWERYRGSVGGVAFVGADDAYAFPLGVPDLFITRYGPADYNETVNTIGQPIYSKMEPLEMGRGYRLEAQSNQIHLCTRPKAVVKLTKV